jgi:AraC-like DNA-binding protein
MNAISSTAATGVPQGRAASGLHAGDIAGEVGYRSELSFVEAFRTIHGITPPAYRQASRHAAD